MFRAMKWNYQISAIKMELWETSVPRLASVIHIVLTQQGSLVLCKTTTRWVLTWAMDKGWSTHSFRDVGTKVLSLRGSSGSSRVGDTGGICYAVGRIGFPAREKWRQAETGDLVSHRSSGLIPATLWFFLQATGLANAVLPWWERQPPLSQQVRHISALLKVLTVAMTRLFRITYVHGQKHIST